MAFDKNPFGFGDDAAFIDSPVTMLKVGGENKSHDSEGANQTGKNKVKGQWCHKRGVVANDVD